jgi:hypothetical protein
MGFGKEHIGAESRALVHVLTPDTVYMIVYLRRRRNRDYELCGLGSIFSRGKDICLHHHFKTGCGALLSNGPFSVQKAAGTQIWPLTSTYRISLNIRRDFFSKYSFLEKRGRVIFGPLRINVKTIL